MVHNEKLERELNNLEGLLMILDWHTDNFKGIAKSIAELNCCEQDEVEWIKKKKNDAMVYKIKLLDYLMDRGPLDNIPEDYRPIIKEKIIGLFEMV